MVDRTNNGRASSESIVELPWHQQVFTMLAAHRLVLLVGDPGVGKTTLALHASRKLTGHEPILLQGSPETDELHIWGRDTLDSTGTRFQDGPLPKAMKNKRFLVIEEFSLIPVEARSLLMELRGLRRVTNPVTLEEIDVPDEFRIIATSNSESLGCRRDAQLMRAVLDDFLVLKVPAPSEAQMTNLLQQQFPNAARGQIASALGHWKNFSEIKAGDSKSQMTLTYRSAAHLIALVLAGMPEREAIEIALVNPYVLDDALHQAASMKLMMQEK